MSYRFWIGIAGILGALAVVAGSIGSHALTGYPPYALKIFDLAQRYHMTHVLALLAVAWVVWVDQQREQGYNWLARLAGHAFIGGVILFSGVLYWQALTGLHPRFPLVPTGGMLFIVGWVALGLSAFMFPRGKRKANEPKDD